MKEKLQKIISDNIWLGSLLFMASVSPLILAYGAEYGFGLLPCVLCLYQRVPFAVIAVLSIVMLALGKNHLAAKIILILCAVAFFIGAGIAIYHVGVEQKLWAGTSGCGGGGTPDSLEELKAQIMGAAIVRCDEPAFVFLGISMSGYNAIYSTILGFVSLYLFMMMRRGKRK